MSTFRSKRPFLLTATAAALTLLIAACTVDRTFRPDAAQTAAAASHNSPAPYKQTLRRNLAHPSGIERNYADWPAYLGDAASTQYSQLNQINVTNVADLEVAWTYNSGGLVEGRTTQIQSNPLIIDGILYGPSADARYLFALNAATGEELWKLDTDSSGVCRGLVFWQNPSGGEQRIFFSVADKLYAINAATGLPIPSFGSEGAIDLHDDLGRDVSNLQVNVRTPGVTYKDLLIIGSSLSEGPATAPGHLRAYDVRTGKLRWIFHTIPQPGEPGNETWPEGAWERFGGANAWSGISVDHKRGMVFFPTGSPAFDFWGGNRNGANLYGNCLLALDAETGKLRWYYQFVHHDVWDRDLPSAPNLVTLEQDGKLIDAVAQTTKSGHVFVFNRETGIPLFPIEEKPYPASDLRGELTWPTQPLPLKPPALARQQLTEEDINNHDPAVKADLIQRLRTYRNGGQFVPPSVEGTVIFPGFDGGAEWGGAAVDPHTGIMYVNTNEMPWILTMVDLSAQAAQGMTPGRLNYTIHCAACHGMNREGNINAGGTYPPLINLEGRLTPETVDEQIRNGKGFMPAFAFLTEEQRAQIIDFIFEREQAPTEDEAKNAPTPRRNVRPSNFAGSAYGHTGYNRFVDPNGNPAVSPPWGNLHAVDLNAGEILWTVPLGELDYLTEKGIPPTGTENYGGPVVTAGGVIFIAATKDEKFRAFDRRNGQILFETTLPAAGFATPATYEADGTQYVVIAAGGGKIGVKSGDAYIAFKLPN